MSAVYPICPTTTLRIEVFHLVLLFHIHLAEFAKARKIKRKKRGSNQNLKLSIQRKAMSAAQITGGTGKKVNKCFSFSSSFGGIAMQLTDSTTDSVRSD